MMLHFLVILMFGMDPVLAQIQAHEDSSIIYNAYKDNIRTLKETNDLDKWYKTEDTLSFSTACSFRRLKLYNNEEYKPMLIYDRKGFGIAPYFPPASGIIFTTPDVHVNAHALSLYRTTAYSIIWHQTKFIIDDKGRSVTPYIERVYFDAESKIIKTVKLNPVTYLPLKSEQKDSYLTYK